MNDKYKPELIENQPVLSLSFDNFLDFIKNLDSGFKLQVMGEMIGMDIMEIRLVYLIYSEQFEIDLYDTTDISKNIAGEVTIFWSQWDTTNKIVNNIQQYVACEEILHDMKKAFEEWFETHKLVKNQQLKEKEELAKQQ